MLRADKNARLAHAQMLHAPEYQNPASWSQASLDGVDALLLPGGHRARGMRSYIDSDTRCIGLSWTRSTRGLLCRGPICHGVLLAKRILDPSTGRSVLYGHKTTALTWGLERRAWQLDPHPPGSGTATTTAPTPKLPGQPTGYMSVQSEVTRALEDPALILRFCHPGLATLAAQDLRAWFATPPPTRGRRS